MFRRRGEQPADPLAHIRPDAVPPRFAAAVADALAARERWVALVGGLRPGPLRDRLVELGAVVDAGVLGVWDTVERAGEVERIAAQLDVERITAEFKAAQRDPAAPPELVESLRQRFVSTQRVLNALDDVDGRLRLLDARLGAAVAHGAEVALIGAGAGGLAAELGSVVEELGALRDSLGAI